MAVRTATELGVEIDTLLADNTTGAISAADLRSILTDIRDSLYRLATESNAGLAELADNDEIIDGDSDSVVVTPNGVTAMIDFAAPVSASTGESGLVELATDAETITGDDEGRAVTPHGVAAVLDHRGVGTLTTAYQNKLAAAPLGIKVFKHLNQENAIGPSVPPATLYPNSADPRRSYQADEAILLSWDAMPDRILGEDFSVTISSAAAGADAIATSALTPNGVVTVPAGVYSLETHFTLRSESIVSGVTLAMLVVDADDDDLKFVQDTGTYWGGDFSAILTEEVGSGRLAPPPFDWPGGSFYFLFSTGSASTPLFVSAYFIMRKHA